MGKKRKIQAIIKCSAYGIKQVLNLFLFLLGIILIIFLIRETWWLGALFFKEHSPENAYSIIEAIVAWFLYFEFIALIVKYFETNFHFPLRYFIYIGITAIIRLIVVDHEKPEATLIYSLAILALLGALYIANSNLLKRV